MPSSLSLFFRLPQSRLRHSPPFGALATGAVLIIGAIVGMNALVLDNLREDALRNAEVTLSGQSATLAEQADRAIQSIELILANIAQHLAALGIRDRVGFRSRLTGQYTHDVLKEHLAGLPQLAALALVGSDGDVVNRSRGWPAPKTNVSDQEYFQESIASDREQNLISAPKRRPDGGWTVLMVHRIAGPDGRIIGLIVGELALSYFEEFYKSLAFGDGNAFALFRDDGVLLIRHPTSPQIGERFSADLDKVLQGRARGTLRAVSALDGEMRVWAAQRLKSYPLAMATSMTRRSALASWRDVSRLIILISAASALVVLIAAFCLALWWKEHDEAAQARTVGAEAEKARALAETALLREREQAAAAASRAKSDFLATMSHEIRTPMNALIGLTSTLLESKLEPEQRVSVLAMHDAGNNLLRILNDILDFSKLEAGRLDFEQIPFSPTVLVDNVLSIVGPRASEKGLRISCEHDHNIPPVLIGDPGRLRQVLLNLLSNAVKFTDRGGVAVVLRGGARAADRVTLDWTVSDTGIGIAPENLGGLFADFAQADSSIHRRFGGTGLGLAICKRIIEQMGGEIDVRSAVGEGSSFHFRLTLPWADALKLEQQAGKDVVAELKACIAALGRPLRVLIAEDNPTNQLVAMQMMKEFDPDLRIASNGAEAVAAATQDEFDLIFMDVRMPVMDGLEATRTIRSKGGRLAAVPVIAVTANAYSDDVKLCRAAGMTGFVAKPVRKEALVKCMITALAGAAAAEKRRSPPVEPGGSGSAGQDEGPEIALDAGEAIDLVKLDRLAEEIGVDAACAVVTVFLDETRLRLERMRAFALADGRDLLRAEAHALKGAAATLGAVQVSALARRLEGEAFDISPADLMAALDRIEAAFFRAQRHFPAEFAGAA